MNLSKKLIASFLTLTIMAGGLFAPLKANAIIVTLNSLDSDYYDHGQSHRRHRHHHAGGGIWIITESAEDFFLFLFILVLDEKAPDQGLGITKTQLLNNGYTNDEVEQITVEQDKLLKALVVQGKSVKLSATETRESLKADLLIVQPELSDLYLDTIADYSGLK